MTRKHLIILAIAAVVAAAALLAVNMQLLPMNTSWGTNRLLHYVWEILAVLAAIGGGVWTLWPRNTGARKDKARLEAQRRVYGLVGIVVVTVLLMVYGEVRRESLSRLILETDAGPALKTISAALDQYAADHGGATPKSIEDLAPKYLKAGDLQYPEKYGPRTQDSVEGVAPAAPSYALAVEIPDVRSNRPALPEYRAYLRPGHAWAALTAVVDKSGQVEIVSDDSVNRFEWQFHEK
jgi:hypothetical protein